MFEPSPVCSPLIDKITVSERVKNTDGQFEQTITIYYKFVGCMDDFTMSPTKANRCASEKVCAECGTTFVPGSNVAKYCPTCSKEIHRKQSNESKRRSRENARNVSDVA